MKNIEIKKIHRDKEFFLRLGYSDDAVNRYMEMYEAGKTNPILVAKKEKTDGDKTEYILVDGFHRISASKNMGREFIDANIEEIKPEDIRQRALQENLKHGVALTKLERDMQIIKLAKTDNKTERAIADTFGIGESRISQILKDQGLSKRDITNLSWQTKNQV